MVTHFYCIISYLLLGAEVWLELSKTWTSWGHPGGAGPDSTPGQCWLGKMVWLKKLSPFENADVLLEPSLIPQLNKITACREKNVGADLAAQGQEWINRKVFIYCCNTRTKNKWGLNTEVSTDCLILRACLVLLWAIAWISFSLNKSELLFITFLTWFWQPIHRQLF